MKFLTWLIVTFVWVAGLVIAKGFWSTVLALFVPLWSAYLVVERLLIFSGII